jgi:hypothetical protein
MGWHIAMLKKLRERLVLGDEHDHLGLKRPQLSTAAQVAFAEAEPAKNHYHSPK